MSQQIIDSLLTRKSSDRYGIGTADRYFRSVETCFDGGFCPIKLFPSLPQDAWQSMLKSAESTLVYTDEGMGISEFRKDGPAGLTSGAVADLDVIVTSTRKDRDGDILEASGARLDPKAPLLFHHIPMEPIGKVITELGRNNKQLSAKVSIINTETGRDAAQLVEFGALRISHGFRPLKFKPLEDKGDQMIPGWHITEYEIMEISLVTVPSNVDAVITAFSRGKLHSPLIKGMAEHEFQSRPVQGVGFSHTQKMGDHEMSWSAPSMQELQESIDMTLNESKMPTSGSQGTPTAPIAPIQPVAPVQQGGGSKPAKSACGEHCSCDKCAPELDAKDFHGMTGETADHSHTVKLDNDGNGKTGTAGGHMHEVKEFDVMEADGHSHELTKDGLDEKSLKRISGKDKSSLQNAADDLDSALKIDDMPRSAKALIRSAKGSIASFLKRQGIDESSAEPEETKTLEEMFAEYLNLNPVSAAEIIGQAAATIREQEASEMLDILSV